MFRCRLSKGSQAKGRLGKASGQRNQLPKLPGLRPVPVVDVLTDLIFGQPVALLNLAFELVAFPVDRGQVVVGELGPLFLDLAFDLFPVSFNTIPIHACLVDQFWGGVTIWGPAENNFTAAQQST